MNCDFNDSVRKFCVIDCNEFLTEPICFNFGGGGGADFSFHLGGI
jgi:hypothetical protein